MNENGRELAPTLTMAQLYESQNEYFDALAIYDKLHKNNPAADVSDRIATLREKILSERGLRYNPRLLKFFEEEELRALGVLPAEKYQAYVSSREALEQQEETENEPAIEVDDQDDDDFPKPDILSDAPKREIVEKPKEPVAMGGFTAFTDMTAGELAGRLTRLVEPDRKLSDLTLGEIVRIMRES